MISCSVLSTHCSSPSRSPSRIFTMSSVGTFSAMLMSLLWSPLIQNRSAISPWVDQQLETHYRCEKLQHPLLPAYWRTQGVFFAYTRRSDIIFFLTWHRDSFQVTTLFIIITEHSCRPEAVLGIDSHVFSHRVLGVGNSIWHPSCSACFGNLPQPCLCSLLLTCCSSKVFISTHWSEDTLVTGWINEVTFGEKYMA